MPTPETQDFIVSELIKELRDQNERKDKLSRNLLAALCGSLAVIVLIVVGFLWYLNQYDFSSTEVIEATGVYTLVDSEGNVVAQDLSPEDLEAIMEVIDGEDQNNSNQE